MRHIREVIVVEGKYDKNTVAQAVSGTIIETSGFGVFSDNKKVALLKRLAEKRGLIILTDSDKAGFFIRGKLHGMLNSEKIKHAYIPDIAGCERRKSASSKEGKIGVEGMKPDIIITVLERAGATFVDEPLRYTDTERITKADMFSVGLSGCADSSRKRAELLHQLDLPERLSANGLLDVLNVLFTRDEFLQIARL